MVQALTDGRVVFMSNVIQVLPGKTSNSELRNTKPGTKHYFFFLRSKFWKKNTRAALIFLYLFPAANCWKIFIYPACTLLLFEIWYLKPRKKRF